MKIFGKENSRFIEESVPLKSHSFSDETTVSWVPSEIDVCLAVVATAIKYLSATALHHDALAAASTGYVK